MKKLILPLLAGSLLLISANRIGTMKKNNVAGCWKLVSGFMDNHGKQIEILGAHPGGMVIFTEDLHFIVIVHNPDIPKFVSGDRATGTPEEYKTAVMNSFGLFGTYEVDENGDFLAQHVEGSTFPNLNGSSRGRSVMTEKVEGDRMKEKVTIADGVSIQIVWQRTSSIF